MAETSARARGRRDLRRRWYGTPAKVFMETELALESTRDHLDAFERQVQRFHSKHFRKRSGPLESFLENHYYDWVTYIVPRIAFSAPRVRVASKIPGVFGQDARALQGATNRWIKDHAFEKLLEDIAIDMQFNWAVAYFSQQPLVGAKPVEGIDPEDPDVIGIPHAPAAYRIMQDLFFEDANARQRSDLRFRGHVFGRDLDLLLEEARKHPERGWNEAVLEHLSTSATNERLRRDERFASERGEVALREVWVPEAELDEYWDGTPAPDEGWRAAGFNGLFFTVADEATEDWVRDPRPAYVPPLGPYEVFGCFAVPGSTKFLSPLIAVEEQVLELNAHSRALARSAADFKRLAFVDALDPKLPAMVRDAKHHGVLPVKGFKRESVQEIEVGGPSAEMLTYRAILLDRLNRNSHMDDPARGKTTGSTAYEANLANAATETRTEWIGKKLVEGTAGGLSKVLWFEYMDNRSIWPGGEEMQSALGIPSRRTTLSDGRVIELAPNLTFRGGAGSNPNSPPFSALDLEVEPYSTRRATEAEMREQFGNASNFLLTTLPLIPVFKWVRWRQLYKLAADAFAAPALESVIDFERASQEGPDFDMLLPAPALMNQRTGATSPSARPGQIGAAGRGRGGQQNSTMRLLQGAGRGRGGQGEGRSRQGASGKASPKVGAALSAV